MASFPKNGHAMTRDELAGLIDHTVLKPEAARADIERLCAEALEYEFCAVCINPVWVTLAKQRLMGSLIKVATVVGFPLGANTTQIKAEETRRAVEDGSDEIDMVMQVGMLKSGDDSKVRHDIEAVALAAAGRPVKVILECALLTDNEKTRACKLAMDAGAAFVKTSTGFCAAGGAKVEDVRLMRQTVGSSFGVKAAGGIRTVEQAIAMVSAGASRLGLSASVAIVNELNR